ncbi:MAG: transpeptidase family protein [Bryobacteraceae bacterium]|nr:transpeptidase family protein [Bryobacteraceae bacterium]
MPTREEDLAIPRLKLFARVCLVWGLVIVLRLIQLQVVQHESYARQAQMQQERQIEVRAPRGAIFDRNGQPLAMSVSVDSVCVNPQKVPNLAMAADILSRVLDLEPGELLQKLATASEAKRGFLWVKRKISFQESERLRAYDFDWVELRKESTRYYPKGALAAHVLGGVDHGEHGNGGVEQFFDKELHGQAGVTRTTADVRQNVFDSRVHTDPLPGATLHLAIDERIQYVAEQELAKAVKEHNASTGSAVVMDPRTGDVLAIANYPSYNPNEPPTDRKSFEARKNLAVMAPFEPGSVFKVVTLSAALETTRLTPDSSFYCGNGAFTLFRRVIHDAHPHGTLSMADILARSSNIGAIKVGLVAGNQNLYDYVKKFGFGAKTGIPLPGEGRGVVRPLNRWIASSIGSVAMGHEISTTAVQLARACSVIANGGMLVKPRLVRSIARGTHEPVEVRIESERILVPENAMKMRRMMQRVVDDARGTGKAARLNGYSSAGKTGSAQIYDFAGRKYTHRYNGSFMGFAPVNNPAIVIAVTLNNTAKYGGVVAGPVFHKVATAALRYLDVPKDRPEDQGIGLDDLTDGKDFTDENDASDPDPLMPPVTIESDEAPSILLASASTLVAPPQAPAIYGPKAPDFVGKSKRDVIAASLETGVRVEMSGAGLVRQQSPPAGSALQPGERVRLVFSR